MSEPVRCTLAPDALSLTNVHTFYGDSHILHGVSFSLQPGGVLALLGRNGAGKTTCISTIISFLKPRDGEIRLFGEAIEGLSPERISHLGIGLVPQGRRIFPSLTVRENLVVAQQRERTTEQPWNVDRIYTMFPRLRERHAQIAGTLSGGELQMLAIGRALMGNPRVLSARRAVGGPGAADRRRGRPYHPTSEAGGTVHRSGRTKSPAGARRSGSGGHPQHRPLRVRRQRRRHLAKSGIDRAKSRQISCTLEPSTQPSRSNHENRRMRNWTNGVGDRARFVVGRQ